MKVKTRDNSDLESIEFYYYITFALADKNPYKAIVAFQDAECAAHDPKRPHLVQLINTSGVRILLERHAAAGKGWASYALAHSMYNTAVLKKSDVLDIKYVTKENETLEIARTFLKKALAAPREPYLDYLSFRSKY